MKDKRPLSGRKVDDDSFERRQTRDDDERGVIDQISGLVCNTNHVFAYAL